MDAAQMNELSEGVTPSGDAEKPSTPPEKTGPERKPCNLCGKLVTWTQAGKPRQHKCVPKEGATLPDQVQTEEVVTLATQPTSPSGITPDAVISKYIETRDEISALEKVHKERVKALKEFQTKRENYLQGMMQKLGVEKLGAGAGTVFFDWKDTATVEDPDKFKTWVHADWEAHKHFLENRVSKSAVKQRHEDGKTSPDGVKYVRFKGVKIRRA